MNSRESIIIFVVAVLMAGGAVGAYILMTQELNRVPASRLAELPKSTSQPAPANTNQTNPIKSAGNKNTTPEPAAPLPAQNSSATPASPAPASNTSTGSGASSAILIVPTDVSIIAERMAPPAAATNMYAEAVANSPKLSTADAAAINAFVKDTTGDEAILKKAIAVTNKYVATLKKFDTFGKKAALACSTWAAPHACDTAALVRLAMLQQVRAVSLVEAQKIPQAIELATLIYSMGDKLEERADSVAAYDAALEVRMQGLSAFSYISANDKTTDEQRTAFRKHISGSLPEKTWNKRAIQTDLLNLGTLAIGAVEAGNAATSSKYTTKAQGALVTSYIARKKTAVAKDEKAWDIFETYKELYDTDAEYRAAIDAPCPNGSVSSTGTARSDISSSTPNWLGSAFTTSWKALFPAAAGLNEKRCAVEKMAGEI